MRVGGGRLAEFNAEFKFAKIQNSYVEVGALRNLMLSSNLLKSKIPILRGGGLMEFDAEFKFAQIQNSHGGGGGSSQNLMLGELAEFDA